ESGMEANSARGRPYLGLRRFSQDLISMLSVARRLITIVLALVLTTATVAIAAADSGLYRTDHRAEQYLTHGLRRWAGVDLRTLRSKTAYCVGAADQSGGGLDRLNSAGVPVYRSFSCVLNVRVESGRNGTRVFQLDLLKKRHGWRATSDSG